jgi:hypothetical protein
MPTQVDLSRQVDRHTQSACGEPYGGYAPKPPFACDGLFTIY